MTVIAQRYQLETLLGRGGMGEVWLATQLNVGNRVAVKLLHAPTEDRTDFRNRFLAEARIGVSLRHPGIAQVLDAGQEPDGRLFIVFELVDGDDLRRLLQREGRLPWRRARDIVARIGEALAFAHERGVVHRDVKPENVRVQVDLVGVHVKVLDFGIARARGDARLTAQGSFTGTPAYMAPEQAEDGDVDGRADQYCLGLVLFELVTGRRVVPEQSTTSALMAQLTRPIPPLRGVNPALDWPALDALLVRACAKEPAKRFSDLRAFLEALLALPDAPWSDAALPKVEASAPELTRDGQPTRPSTPAARRMAGGERATPGALEVGEPTVVGVEPGVLEPTLPTPGRSAAAAAPETPRPTQRPTSASAPPLSPRAGDGERPSVGPVAAPSPRPASHAEAAARLPGLEGTAAPGPTPDAEPETPRPGARPIAAALAHPEPVTPQPEARAVPPAPSGRAEARPLQPATSRGPQWAMLAAALFVTTALGAGVAWRIRGAPANPTGPVTPPPEPPTLVQPPPRPLVAVSLDAGPAALLVPPGPDAGPEVERQALPLRTPVRPPLRHEPSRRPPAPPSDPPSAPRTEPPAGVCPQLAQFAPEFHHLDKATLVSLYKSTPYVAPSGIARTLTMIDTMAESFAPETRECQERAQVVAQIVASRTMPKLIPHAWAHTWSVAKLEALYRTAPLLMERTPEKRSEVLAATRAMAAPPDPTDLLWVHQMLLGELLACELTDEGLGKLGARRHAPCRVW